jgi:hypothetical protein
MNRRTTLTLTALTAPALALVLAGSSASASTTGPTGSAADSATPAVARAVAASPLVAGVPAGSFTVTDVRVAGDWAAADLAPTDPTALDPATAVLQRVAGGTTAGTGWTVVDLGTAGVGCDTVPVADRGALALSC